MPIKKAPSQPLNDSHRGRNCSIALVILLAIGITCWAFTGGSDAQLKKIEQMRAEAMKEGLTPEQRRQNFEQIHQEIQKLTPQQRETFFEQGREEFERRHDQEIATYFNLPPDQRKAFLDKQIQEMEERRKQWEARRNQNNPSGVPPDRVGQPGAPDPNAKDQNGRSQRPGGGRPPQNLSTDERLKRQDKRLDHSSAEQRAMRAAYRAELDQRRRELGLPAFPGPNRGPGR